MNGKKKLRRLPKRILSFVMTVAMVITLMPGMSIEVKAEGMDPNCYYCGHIKSEHICTPGETVMFCVMGSSCSCEGKEWRSEDSGSGNGADADLDDHENHTGWTEWTSSDSLPTAAGSYVLKTDVTIPEDNSNWPATCTWEVPSGTVNLCLNGHVIKGSNEEYDGSFFGALRTVITINENATLNLYDCDTTEHKFSVDTEGLWSLDEMSGNQTVAGGCITGGRGTSDDSYGYGIAGGGVYVNGGNFNMHGGNVIGNYMPSYYALSAAGGGVYVKSGSFTMYGGVIKGNVAGAGGGVSVYSDGQFHMYGGSIADNVADSGFGGGVYVDTDSVTVGGTAKIQGNTAASGANCNVQLGTYKLALATGDNAPVSGADGMKIGIFGSTEMVIVPSGASSTDTQFFSADDENYEIFYDNNQIKLRARPSHTHTWAYKADGATLKAYCTQTDGADACSNQGSENDLLNAVSLTLTATSPNYSGIEGLDAFNTATGRTTDETRIKESDVKFYTVTTEGATTGGTNETSTAPTADGYYYASLTVGGVTAVKAFTIGNPGGLSTKEAQICADVDELSEHLLFDYIFSDINRLNKMSLKDYINQGFGADSFAEMIEEGDYSFDDSDGYSWTGSESGIGFNVKYSDEVLESFSMSIPYYGTIIFTYDASEALDPSDVVDKFVGSYKDDDDEDYVLTFDENGIIKISGDNTKYGIAEVVRKIDNKYYFHMADERWGEWHYTSLILCFEFNEDGTFKSLRGKDYNCEDVYDDSYSYTFSLVEGHEHSFTYSVPDAAKNTIVATCANTDGNCDLDDGMGAHKVSLALTATSPDYSDSTTGWCLAEDVAIELEGASDWGVVGDLPTIHYVGTTADGSEYSSDNKPTQDGSYTTYIVCDEAKAELNFEIGHVFGEVVKDEYLALPADYTSPAKYYNSCEICGEKGKETFTDGKKLQLTTPKLSNTSVTVDSIVVKWSSVEDAELYRVFRKNDAGTWVKVNDTTTNSFEDKNVESGKSYTYTVRCVSADGKTYMSAYNKTGVTATYCSMPELKSAKPLVSGVQIVWDDVAGAVCYRVYRKVSGGSWENVGETDAALFVDETAVSGNKYIYTVKCIDSSKTKAVSAYNNKGISVTFYSAPSLKSIGVYNDGVRLTWKEVTGAPKYRVYRKTNDGAWEALGAVETTSYVDTTAEIGKKYTYTVRCVNEKNTVKYSSYNGTGRTVIVCEKPKITAISSTTEGVNVEWGAVADASSYRLYRKVVGGEWIKIANTTSTSYVDTTAVKGTRYKYTVRCLDPNERKLFSGYDTAGKAITFK